VVLLALAYRQAASPAAPAVGMAEVVRVCDWSEVARVGDELVLRINDGDTYRVTATQTLEPWIISAEEIIVPPTAAEHQRAAMAFVASRCRDLPLVPDQVRICQQPTGGWRLEWRTSDTSGFGLQVGGAHPDLMPNQFSRRGCGYRCGRVAPPPSGKG